MWPFYKKPPAEKPAVAAKTVPLFSTDMAPSQSRRAIEAALEAIDFHAPAPVPNFATDGRDKTSFFNHATDMPEMLPEALTGWYAAQSFIGHQLCAILAQHWLIDKACTMPARDAVRHGFRVSLPELDNAASTSLANAQTANTTTANAPTASSIIVNAIEKANKRFQLPRQMEEFVRMGRIFGIRVALFDVESSDPDYYTKPFNPDGITKGSYKGIRQIDPNWCSPELDQSAVSDPTSPAFYEPTFWLIGTKRVHRSHVVIFRNSEVPDILKPSYSYGGVPVPQRIMERVYAAERTANEAPQLAMSKRMMVWGTDLMSILTNQERFSEHMNVWTDYQNNYGVKLVNSDDVVNQFETSLADLDSVIATQYQIVASAANVPATKLLGTAPKGFNATGEYEEASYHEELESIQTHDLEPLIERHHLLLMRSEIAPIFGLKRETDIVIDWEALDSPTAKEYAEIGEILSKTDANLLSTGAITATDIARRLNQNPMSGYSNIQQQEPARANTQSTEKNNKSALKTPLKDKIERPK